MASVAWTHCQSSHKLRHQVHQPHVWVSLVIKVNFGPYPLSPYQPIEERPGQHKAAQPIDQSACPERPPTNKVSACIELRCGGGADAKDIDQSGGEEGEEGVEEEAGVGFEAKDASANTEEGGS